MLYNKIVVECTSNSTNWFFLMHAGSWVYSDIGSAVDTCLQQITSAAKASRGKGRTIFTLEFENHSSITKPEMSKYVAMPKFKIIPILQFTLLPIHLVYYLINV